MSQADSSVDIPAHPEPHLLQCSVDAAMTPYIGTMEGRPLLGEDATAGIFDAILEELVENKILNKDGWKAIRTSKQGQIEDAVYDLLALIDSDLKPTTTLRSTGTVISAPETDPFNLEPAKPYTQFFGHNPLTGTPAFMAMEYQRGSYFFSRRGHHTSDTALASFRKKLSFDDGLDDHNDNTTRFNYYHDLESIFWIYLWYLVHRVPKSLAMNESSIHLLRESSKTYFSSDMDIPARTDLILVEKSLLALFTRIANAYTSEFQMLPIPLSLGSVMYGGYSHLEKNHDPVCGRWEAVAFDYSTYRNAKGVFQEILDAMKDEDDYKAQFLPTLHETEGADRFGGRHR